MSTKIYSGFAWDCPDFGQVMAALRVLEGHIRQDANTRKATTLAQMATGLIDRACTALATHEETASTEAVKPDNLETPLIDAWQKMWDRQDKMRQSMRRDPFVDFEVRIVMWYVPETKMFVGHVISDDRFQAYRTLLTCPGVSDFSYWDNTDQPEQVSPEEWDARGTLWDRVFDNEFGLPLVITVDADEMIEREAIEQNLPLHEKRVAKIALDTAFKLWQKEKETFRAKQVNGAEQDLDVDKVVSTWLDFSDEMDKPESAAFQLIADEKVRVANLLPVDIRPLLESFSEEKVQELLARNTGNTQA